MKILQNFVKNIFQLNFALFLIFVLLYFEKLIFWEKNEQISTETHGKNPNNTQMTTFVMKTPKLMQLAARKIAAKDVLNVGRNQCAKPFAFQTTCFLQYFVWR